MSATARAALGLHALLAAYVWLVECVPLGDWNRQPGQRLLPALLHGPGASPGDFAVLALAALPALFCWLGFRRPWRWCLALTLVLDLIWAFLQWHTWWRPYLFGTTGWQLRYAAGPTTKWLPSFGNHPAPDAMHLVIHLLLATALFTTAAAWRRLPRRHGN
jgi:hypothetical protein